MKEEQKMTITQDLVEGFANMIKSEDPGDSILALDILQNRDKNDPESEKHFQDLSKLICNEALFPLDYSSGWVVKCNGKIMVLKSSYVGRSVFNNMDDAKRSLSAHLTKFIGKSKANSADYTAEAFYRGTSPAQIKAIQQENQKYHDWNVLHGYNQYKSNPHKQRHIPYAYSSQITNWKYDPNFDKKKFIADKHNEELKRMGTYHNWTKNPNYFKAIKMIFKGGRELRDFLLENGIVTIEKIY